ncbi:TPA: YecR family lipoprotein [Citrobacter freundii]
MKKITLCCLCVLALSGCTVQKQMTPVGGSKADGTIRMGYHVGDSYGAFEKANVDLMQGQSLAAQKCRVWGYDGAEAFGGQTSQCTDPSPMGCRQADVYIEYQCTGGKASQN